MDGLLFPIEDYTDERIRAIMAGHTCRECGHRIVSCYRDNSYCEAISSKLTKNGLLKVKANQPACIKFTNKNNAK